MITVNVVNIRHHTELQIFFSWWELVRSTLNNSQINIVLLTTVTTNSHDFLCSVNLASNCITDNIIICLEKNTVWKWKSWYVEGSSTTPRERWLVPDGNRNSWEKPRTLQSLCFFKKSLPLCLGNPCCPRARKRLKTGVSVVRSTLRSQHDPPLSQMTEHDRAPFTSKHPQYLSSQHTQ